MKPHTLPLLCMLLPELILAGMACVLFLLGVINKTGARRAAPILALLALAAVFLIEQQSATMAHGAADAWGTLYTYNFSHYIKLLAAGVGIMLVLLAWPTNATATGNSALYFGQEAGEFFALMLLSIAGIFLTASANDIILLFLGLELTSIPTYVMVSISRPLPAAQEAGVKYFFLGAMSAALMLFGFSYLYGTTGLLSLDAIAAAIGTAPLSSWQMLAVLLLVVGFAFKIAAVPMHFYAGDVYEGAATPVTAFLSFVPKTAGFVALVKLVTMTCGSGHVAPPHLVTLLGVLAALTMTVGNVLGLLQHNIKRVFAYSSIAHSGYMLVGLTAFAAGHTAGLVGLLFYLAAYGIMNAGAFGVLMLLPSRSGKPTTSAETFEDLAGQGRRHVGLGLAMAVSCFSLIGLPLTIGFFGKLMLIVAAYSGGFTGLALFTMVNAVIAAAYYLRIVAAMFLRPLPATDAEAAPAPCLTATPIVIAVVLSASLTLLLGIVLPITQQLTTSAQISAQLEAPAHAAQPAP